MPYIYTWEDVVFAALLLGLASYAFERDHARAANYTSFYDFHCRQSWQRFHERENECRRWREAQFEILSKTKAALIEQNRKMSETLQREGEKKCSQLQKKLSSMMSIKKYLERKFGQIYELTEEVPSCMAPIVKVCVRESMVRISYLDSTERHSYQLTFFNRQGLITGDLKFLIKPAWGIFGGDDPNSTNERDESCFMRNGDPVYYAIREMNVK